MDCLIVSEHIPWRAMKCPKCAALKPVRLERRGTGPRDYTISLKCYCGYAYILDMRASEFCARQAEDTAPCVGVDYALRKLGLAEILDRAMEDSARAPYSDWIARAKYPPAEKRRHTQ